MPWQSLRVWVDRYLRSSLPDDIDIPNVLSYGSCTNVAQRSLLQELYNTRQCLSSDRRDKIFALLGIVEIAAGFEADYSLSDIEVYTSVAAHCVRSDSSLRLLSAGQGYTQPSMSERLDMAGTPSGNEGAQRIDAPTWVPDWTNISPTAISLGLGETYMEAYNAGGLRAIANLLQGDSSGMPRVLKARGLLIGKIERLGKTYLPEWWSGFQQWYDIALESKLYGAPKKVKRAFCQTLTARSESSTSTNEQWLWKQYRAWEYYYLDSDRYDNLFGYDALDASYRNLDRLAERFRQKILKFSRERRFMLTNHGRMGLAPPEARTGNEVCVLLGAPVPCVLREQNDPEKHHVLVGESYVHGIMNGQALVHLRTELEAVGLSAPIIAKGVSDDTRDGIDTLNSRVNPKDEFTFNPRDPSSARLQDFMMW